MDAYYASHSLLVFGIVFGIAWLLANHPISEMLGWSLHILIVPAVFVDLDRGQEAPLIDGLRMKLRHPNLFRSRVMGNFDVFPHRSRLADSGQALSSEAAYLHPLVNSRATFPSSLKN